MYKPGDLVLITGGEDEPGVVTINMGRVAVVLHEVTAQLTQIKVNGEYVCVWNHNIRKMSTCSMEEQ